MALDLKENTDDTCLQEIIMCKTYFLKRKDLRVPFYNKTMPCSLMGLLPGLFLMTGMSDQV